MKSFWKHAAQAIGLLLFLLAVGINSPAKAGDPPKHCTREDNRNPEVKDVYTDTVTLWPSGGQAPNNRFGWQCFLHNINDFMSVDFDIRTASGEHPPFYFESVQVDRDKQVKGYTMVVIEFYPNCNPHCTTDPGPISGTYTVRFRPQAK
jgi:hypothetical protein